jgi:four helix bundle protein
MREAMAFNHENLKVYQRTLSFNVKVEAWTGQWDSKHAICDQLPRAAGSMLENIAMASAAYSMMKLRGLDYAIGSSLECAACLDLALVKRLLDAESVGVEKAELSQILRMLVGLRKSWASSAHVAREGAAEYSTQGEGIDKARDKDSGEGVLFHHQTLDVYRVALEATTAFCSSANISRLSNTVFRKLDELLTSMVLNIAEGNGRFSDADQARFLGTSHESAIKLAARLDLCVTQALLQRDEVLGWKALLERVSVMTASMIAGIQR